MPSRRPIIHLIAPAGSCRDMLEGLGCASGGQLIELIQGQVGPGYRVTGNNRLIEAAENDLEAGRDDDRRRAGDLQRALANDRVAAILALRGGAWLTRILPRIDFGVLGKRSTRVALFGFSELTTIINIAARYRQAVCWYDMGPAFIPAGLALYVRRKRTGRLADSSNPGPTQLPAPGQVRGWTSRKYPHELAEFLADLLAMIKGRGSSRHIKGRLLAGRLPDLSRIKIIGGTLSVLVSLIGTQYARSIFQPGRWLALEDVNEAPHRLDRFCAHLQLAGILDRCGGLLLGDFHEGAYDRTAQVVQSLKRILPPGSKLPIIASPDFGHTWPMAPLPINRQVELHRRGSTVELLVPWEKLATV